MKRFFGEIENEKFVITGSELFHLQKVLRLKIGDKIVANCNDSFDYICTIEQLNKNECVCNIEEKNVCIGLPKKNIVLFQAMPKKDYFDTIISKTIELGISEIVPFISDFSVNREIKKERVQNQIVTACKQCELSKTIRCEDLISFESMLKRIKAFDVILFANEDDNENQKFSPSMVKDKKNIGIIVGCEAGFSENERKKIINAGAISLNLGKRILRNDTAAIVMTALASLFSDN